MRRCLRLSLACSSQSPTGRDERGGGEESARSGRLDAAAETLEASLDAFLNTGDTVGAVDSLRVGSRNPGHMELWEVARTTV